MLCKKCGIEIPDDAVKCPACDAEVSETEEIAADIPEVSDDSVDDFDAVENITPATGKSKRILWVVVAAIIALVIAAAAFIGISVSFENQLANVSNPSAVAKLFGVKEENVAVYILTKKDNNFVYVKTDKGDQHLVRKLTQNESFTAGSEFVLKGNKLFYLNDEGGLSVMNVKNGKSTVIGDDFKPGTISFSVKGDYLLYVGEDSMLYKSKNGKEATPIEFLGNSIFENQLPSYGFVNETSNVWYAVIDSKTQNADVYLESGDAVLEDVNAVFYVADKGEIAVYSKVTKEETIQPEPVETEEGEETQEAEPVVVKTYALMLKEGAESFVLNDDYIASDSLAFLNKDKKGVIYIAEKGEIPVDEETGEILGSATGKLYFREFGGETKLLDEDVELALILDDLNGTNYYYDASDRVEDETIAYMKENTVAFMKNLETIENPKDFEFISSNPVFGENNNLILYLTYEPTPAKEEEEAAEDAEAAETEETVVQPSKLVYTTFKDGKWSDYTVVAEGVQSYHYNDKKSEIYYTLNENGDMNKLSLYSYSVKDGKSTLVSDSILAGYLAFGEDGAYFVSNFNSETQYADIGFYNGKKTEVIAKEVAGFVATDDGTVYTTKQDGENTDLYVISDNKLELVCKHFVNILFAR